MTIRDHSACGPECFRCRIMGITVMASALPTRQPIVARTVEREKGLVKDRTSFKRMRDQGMQPAKMRGAAELERHAESRFEVESGKILPARYRQRILEAQKEITKGGVPNIG